MPAMNKKSDIILPFPLAFTFTYRMNEFSQKISFRCTGLKPDCLMKVRSWAKKMFLALEIGNAEGQLILKANIDVFIWTKKRTKIFLYFCPSL